MSKLFETREMVPGMRPCKKKPLTVHALRIDEDFRVKTLEGDYAQGTAGDYLMRGIVGELYICNKSIFESSYDWVESGL